MRSNYEHKLGKFKNAITFDMDNMYEFPKIFDTHPLFKKPIKNKKILTYCTGGIKCEKATNFLLKKGFTDVNQLEGGIIRYGMETGGIDVNKVNPKIISNCYVCKNTTDNMVNCINTLCNRHTTICCSEQCSKSDKKRCS